MGPQTSPIRPLRKARTRATDSGCPSTSSGPAESPSCATILANPEARVYNATAHRLESLCHAKDRTTAGPDGAPNIPHSAPPKNNCNGSPHPFPLPQGEGRTATESGRMPDPRDNYCHSGRDGGQACPRGTSGGMGEPCGARGSGGRSNRGHQGWWDQEPRPD